MKYLLKLQIIVLLSLLTTVAIGKENITNPSQKKTSSSSTNRLMKFASDCDPASAQADLDINNVRARILNGGDMWWDLSNARYEIPK